MEKEIIAYGITRSSNLLLIFIAAFIGITFVFVESLFNPMYPITTKALFGAIDALTLVGIVYGIVRYYSEQIINSSALNFASILSQFIDENIEEIEEE